MSPDFCQQCPRTIPSFQLSAFSFQLPAFSFQLPVRYNYGALFLLASALFLGFLHGLGADHLMAIAALSVDGDLGGQSAASRRARALGVASRFAAGHAVLLGAGA